jgi:hypothetical protein
MSRRSTARSFEALESRIHLAFTANVNFQPGGTPPAGYIVDKGEGYGGRVGGWTYGWNVRNTANIFTRNSPKSPDMRYDTIGLMQAPGVTYWQIMVPNGTYKVRVVAGDPTVTSGAVYKINAENVGIVSGTPTAQSPWVEGMANVTVSDGRLTLTNAAGSVDNRIAFVEITDGDTTPPPPPPPPPPPSGDSVSLQFNAVGTGVNGTGFTSVLPTSKGKGLVAGNVTMGNGQLRLMSTAGDLWGTRNNQDNALAVSFDTSRDFIMETRLTSFPFTRNWQNAGLFVGTNEDNYVKLVGGYSGGTSIQLGSESNSNFVSPAFAPISSANFTSLDLRLRGSFASKTITAEYRLNSDTGTWVTLGSVVNAAAFNATVKAGVLTTNFGSTAVQPSFNWFKIDAAAQPDPNPDPNPNPNPNSKEITIGTNLDGIAEFSPIAPFVDLTTMFRGWGSLATPYQPDASIPKTADNYPLVDAGAITFANAYPDGDYQVSYEGQANLSFTGLNASFQVTSSSGGITRGVLHLEPASHPGTLTMYATGINATDPLHNLHIISPDANPSISDTFRPVFLQKLAPFDGFLRMMDWMQTNQNPSINWSDRTSPTRFSYVNQTGVPYEVIAKLANTVDKDLWINIPVMATDDYIHQAAKLFASQLEPGRKIYVEYSNELWAYWAHVDAMWNLNHAKADPAITKTDPWGQSAQAAGKRLVEIGNIFKQEFGATRFASQVRPTLGALVAGASWGDIALQYVQDHYGPVTNYISGMAIGDYVGVINDFAPIDDNTLTLDKLFAWANNWIDTQLATWVKDNKAVADKYGIPLHSYEGGQAFVASNGMNESIKRQAQDDPRMGDLYRHLVRSWTTLSGGGIWGNFATANQYSAFGYWGLLQSINQATSVKYETVKQLINETV